MDTGLNNTNTLHLALDNEYLKDVEWIVEASSEEQYQLWKDNKYCEDKSIQHEWVEVSHGSGYSILEIQINSVNLFNGETLNIKELLPVTINFSFAIIDGHKILFYESNSLLTHYGYIEAFLVTYFQRTNDNYTRWNHTNATNFHNCVGHLNRIDVEPRDTAYQIPSNEKEYFVFKQIKNK